MLKSAAIRARRFGREVLGRGPVGLRIERHACAGLLRPRGLGRRLSLGEVTPDLAGAEAFGDEAPSDQAERVGIALGLAHEHLEEGILEGLMQRAVTPASLPSVSPPIAPSDQCVSSPICNW